MSSIENQNLVLKGMDHHMAGRAEQARAIYAQILQTEPENSQALGLMGMLAHQANDLPTALDYLQRADALSQGLRPHRHSLALVLKDLGRLDEAGALFEQLVAQHPDAYELWLPLAQIRLRQGDYLQAVSCYQQCTSLRADSADAWFDLGVVQLALEQWEAARESLTRVLTLRPNDAMVANNLGVTWKNQGNYAAAREWYDRALEIDPRLAHALFNIGTLYFREKKMKQASIWYLRTLEVEPQHLEANQNLASIYLDAGQQAQAQACRDRAYSNRPLFIDRSQDSVRTVLVLWASGKGNVPIDFLLPKAAYTRIVLVLEYATEEDLRTLPPYDLVFNAIGDPDITAPTRAPMAAFLARCSKKVLNLPQQIERTARDLTATLFQGIPGLCIPHTVRLPTAEFKMRVLQQPGIRLPIIVRPGNSHGGDHLVKLETAQQMAQETLFNAPLYYAGNYHEYRSADGFYRKYRIIFVDRKPYPYHMAIGPHWIVHYETAQMRDHPWKLAEEERFLADPRAALGEQAMAVVEEIGRRMDLDYCGVDFSILPDGQVLLFEANATMLIHPEDPAGVLGHKNQYVLRINMAFNELVQASG